MKTIKIPYIKELNNNKLQKCSQIIEQLGTNAKIEAINWQKEYPYAPITAFDIARSDNALFINYRVTDKNVRAIYTKDQSDVYKDSCVEFFCMVENANEYTNFEFNCIGTCLASHRKGREEGIVPLSKEELQTIERYSSLPCQSFELIKGEVQWHLCVKIPFQLMGIDKNHLPKKIKANFYKCGDETEVMHFVSWSPISTETPDFHRPEFFGELFF